IEALGDLAGGVVVIADAQVAVAVVRVGVCAIVQVGEPAQAVLLVAYIGGTTVELLQGTLAEAVVLVFRQQGTGTDVALVDAGKAVEVVVLVAEGKVVSAGVVQFGELACLVVVITHGAVVVVSYRDLPSGGVIGVLVAVAQGIGNKGGLACQVVNIGDV